VLRATGMAISQLEAALTWSWQEETPARVATATLSADGNSELQEGNATVKFAAVDVFERTPGKSECWESLLVQAKAAEASSSFVFSHKTLDGVASFELLAYLRDECKSKFVDLSCLDPWAELTHPAADALHRGLRSTRSLSLDGNDLGTDPDAFEAWCAAIEEHPGLQLISLRATSLGNAGATRLAHALRHHSVLFSVDLGSNRIGDEAVKAFTSALEENNVLLEVGLENTDVSADVKAELEAALDRNRARYGGIGGCAKLLQGLRRARADAVTAFAHGEARMPAVENCLSRHGDLSLAFDAQARHLSTAIKVDSVGGVVWLPIAPSADQAVEAQAENHVDGVIFDAGEGVIQELSMRCEAAWRYTESDAGLLHDLRRKIADLKAQRQHDYDRFQETEARIAEASRIFNEDTAPMHEEIMSAKEELSVVVESTKRVLLERIELNLALKAAQNDLENAEEDRRHAADNAQHLHHTLKLRHREVDEEAENLKAEVTRCEEATEVLEKENEKFRRRLHAARFETEDERFVPRWAPEERADGPAADAEPEAEATMAAGGAEAPPPDQTQADMEHLGANAAVEASAEEGSAQVAMLNTSGGGAEPSPAGEASALPPLVPSKTKLSRKAPNAAAALMAPVPRSALEALGIPAASQTIELSVTPPVPSGSPAAPSTRPPLRSSPRPPPWPPPNARRSPRRPSCPQQHQQPPPLHQR